MGWAILAVARWKLEQQSEELPFCVSELQQPWQSEQQYWVSYCGLPAEHSFTARVVEWEFSKRAIEEFSPIPAMSLMISKHEPESDSLVENRKIIWLYLMFLFLTIGRYARDGMRSPIS